MAKFTINHTVELRLHVKTSRGGTSVKTHRFAETAAQHYTDETWGRWVMAARANDPVTKAHLKNGQISLEGGASNSVWSRRYAYRDRLYRRALKVFQHYLPMKKK